jgi:hypothetical protein
LCKECLRDPRITSGCGFEGERKVTEHRGRGRCNEANATPAGAVVFGAGMAGQNLWTEGNEPLTSCLPSIRLASS